MQHTDEARNRALDGLRGLAACAVVFYHAILHLDLPLVERVLLPPLQDACTARDALTKVALQVFHGQTAVFVFFVLSGCVLRLSLERQGNAPAARLCAAFAANRVLRLYPPVVACMLLFFALSRLGIPGYPFFAPWQLLHNATLYGTSMHGPSTTVQAEILAVPFLLAAWLLRRRYGPPALVLCLAWTALAQDAPWMAARLPNMHMYLIPFMAGMLVAEPTLRPAFAAAPAGVWWGVFAALVACRAFHPLASAPALIAMVMAAALLVGGLLHGAPGGLSAFLRRPALQALGRVSFSLYLLNVPVLYLIWAWTDRAPWLAGHALEAGLATGALSLALTWPLAWASERWVERPAIAAGRYAAALIRSGPKAAPREQAPPLLAR
ncbi:MAG: acyltransferase [Acetobacteraceae bacterium]|nr:acyltransferase [Acetobacteraceae bacterium]